MSDSHELEGEVDVPTPPGPPSSAPPPPMPPTAPPGAWAPQYQVPAPGALWPPVPYGYYERQLKPPYSQRPAFRPGPVMCLVIAAVSAVAIAASSGPDLGYVEGIAVAIDLLIGLVWLIALINNSQETHFRYDRRAWGRWGAPAAIFFAALIVIGSSLPEAVRFQLSEPALQQSATQITADTGYGPRWIGLYQFYDVRVDGPVRYFDLTLPTDSSGRCSYVYAPQQTTGFKTWISSSWGVQSVGPNWWHGCLGPSYGD